MKFSVVIPCYNAERWIEQTLTSVLAQTLPPHEVVIVNDGSTDQSQSRIESIMNTTSIPLVLVNTNRLGAGGARYAGIDAASGDWLAFLDADDWWDPNHLERIQAAMVDSKDIMYLAAAKHFSINVNRVVSISDSPFQDLEKHIDHHRYFQLLQTHGLLEISAMAMQRQHLVTVGKPERHLPCNGDLELTLRSLHGQTLTYDPVPSSYYRCNNADSLSRQFTRSADKLTSYFKLLLDLKDLYAIPESVFRQQAQTLASKSMHFNAQGRQEILQLVWPYLSQSNQLVFRAASLFPPAYLWLNTVRNKLRGPQYAPRQVVTQGNLN
ncbi:MAG: glycosyltransferase family 2 protein [Prochlorotrichaceae cyanobacterium]|jgi:glycosyltransferase involved in cell wall biosynthesis